MNNLTADLLPLHHSDELLFQIPLISYQQEHPIQQEVLLINPSDCTNPSVKVDKIQRKHRCKSFETSNNRGEGGEVDNKKMKTTHREVERQRRQEMANLYGSLRSLVPREYLKGKRSISDQINGATHYVRHQQKKIKELLDRRDGLKRMLNSSTPNVENRNFCSPNCVVVQPSFAGLEIIIGCSLKTTSLPLSKVFGVLIEEGLGVISYASTTVNEISFHSIQSEKSETLHKIEVLTLQICVRVFNLALDLKRTY
ncbi:hypothetical protein IFM89_031684 [Coptis chinensis]|uniref:BHLH domain-containing protein n=1 Tax=Coptis chinensis TaxID=261450 RepID=A0A835HQN9_9MAGN|nr:hypothetical protein IFM89_031684 [Coptis chinensis]